MRPNDSRAFMQAVEQPSLVVLCLIIAVLIAVWLMLTGQWLRDLWRRLWTR